MTSTPRNNSPRPGSKNIDVLIMRDAAPYFPWSRGQLRTHLALLTDQSGCGGCRLEAHVVTDAVMQRYNMEAMHCLGPTNVLSFPLPLAARLRAEKDACVNPVLSGILILSAETLVRECFLYEQDINSHAIHLLVHGFAHLLGYEHGLEMESFCQEKEKMLHRQDTPIHRAG